MLAGPTVRATSVWMQNARRRVHRRAERVAPVRRAIADHAAIEIALEVVVGEHDPGARAAEDVHADTVSRQARVARCHDREVDVPVVVLVPGVQARAKSVVRLGRVDDPAGVLLEREVAGGRSRARSLAPARVAEPAPRPSM